MASESTEEGAVTVELPSELDDWLDEQAAELGVDRETVLVQVLGSYRASAELNGDLDASELGVDVMDEGDVEATVETYLEDHLDEAVATRLEDRAEETVQSILAETLEDELQEQVQTAVDAAVTERLSEATDAVQQQVENRVDELESEFQEKLEDVRERVIQVKRETDEKAPADHDHRELEQLEGMTDRLDDVESEVDSLREELDGVIQEQGEELEDLEERIDTMQDRLQTVAWVVNDLRDHYESASGMEAVDRIKRAAAKADVDRARCENCENGVEIGLLTDPNCPHCDATVTDIEPASGFFSKPKLLVASQLESGTENAHQQSPGEHEQR